MLTPEVQIFVVFSLWLAVSKIQGQRKSEMHRVTPKWTWTLNSQKYPIHPKYSPLGSKFWSVSLYGQQFPRYGTFYHFPLTTMLNAPKRTKKLPKIQNLKFHNSLSNFGRDPRQEYAWFLGSEFDAYFQRRCRLKFLPPYGPMLTKTKKKIVKNQKIKILKNKKKMVWRYGGYLSVKFGVNPLDGFGSSTKQS